MLQIRPFREDDQAAVVALWQACGLTRPWNDPTRDIERKLTFQPELFLVGEADGAVVASAMAGYEGHRGWVNYLAVAPAQRGRGRGRRLMQEVESRLRALGCPKVNLQVRSSDGAVIAFYRQLGYVQDEALSLGKRLIEDGPKPAPLPGGAFAPPVPILPIFDDAKAREFYVGFLGFRIDWEHRFEPDLPLYLQLSRGACVLHLSGHHGDATPGSALRIAVEDLDALQAHLLAQRAPFARPAVQYQPWGRDMTLHDTFGNRLVFTAPGPD